MKSVIDNVVAFPIPRNKKPTHSKKIEWALRNSITSMGGHYYDDKIKDGILFHKNVKPSFFGLEDKKTPVVLGE